MKNELQFFNSLYLPIYESIEIAKKTIENTKREKLTKKEAILLSLVEFIFDVILRRENESAVDLVHLSSELKKHRLSLFYGYYLLFRRYKLSEQDRLTSTLEALTIGQTYQHEDLIHNCQIYLSVIYYILNEKDKSADLLHRINLKEEEISKYSERSIWVMKMAYLMRLMYMHRRYDQAMDYARRGESVITETNIQFPFTFDFYCHLADLKIRTKDTSGIETIEKVYHEVKSNHLLMGFNIRITNYYSNILLNYAGDPKVERSTKEFTFRRVKELASEIEFLDLDMITKNNNYITKAYALRELKEYGDAIKYLAKAYRFQYHYVDKANHITIHLEAKRVYEELAIRTKEDKYIRKVAIHSWAAFNIMHKELDNKFKVQLDKVTNDYHLEKEKMKAYQLEKELNMTSLHLQEKINTLEELKKYVNSLRKTDYQMGKLILTISNKIESIKVSEEEKGILMQKIDRSDVDYSRKILEKHPQLTSLEVRMCSLFKTGMNNKELSKLFGLSDRSYEQHRYRIKKKMNLNADEGLVEHLKKI